MGEGGKPRVHFSSELSEHVSRVRPASVAPVGRFGSCRTLVRWPKRIKEQRTPPSHLMVQASSRAATPDKEARRRARSKTEDGRAEAAETEATGERAVRLARYYQGKVEVVPSVPVRQLDDFSVWYTPGIAAVSEAIAKEPELSFELTGRWNTIAIVTDGSRVLGLGNIGPRAALPVMEGKSLLFKFLGGVNAYPIPVAVSTQEE